MRTAVRKGSSRLLAALLCVVMLLGLAPVGAVSQSSESTTEFDRIVHLDMGRKYYSPTAIKALIDEMAELGYNQLELDISNNEKGQFRFALDDMDVTYTVTEQTQVLVEDNQPEEETPAAVESGAVSTPAETEAPSAEPSTVPADSNTTPKAETTPAADADQTVQAVVEEVEQLDQPVGSTNELEFEYINVSTDVTKDLRAALPSQGQYITEDEMLDIISYAGENGIEIVPLLNTPGHMGAILDAFPEYSYNGSNSLDITDDDARAFGMAVVEKYAQWFMDQGCDTINIGADEFANDVYSGGGMGFGHLVLEGKYSFFVSYINELAAMLQDMGYTVRAFNDGINYGGQSGVDSSIQVCYWTSGWGSYDVASAEELADAGFTLINTNGEYYYILGKDSSMTNGTIQASDFDPESFSGGSTIYDPAGAMFCIWSDYPDAQTEEEVLSNVQPYLEGFASALTVPVRDSQTGVSVTASGVTNMTVENATVEALSSQDYVAYEMQPTRANGAAYTGSAQVSIPLPENMQGYSDEQLTGFVMENGIPTPVKGTRSGDTYTFEMPHFSVGGVMAITAAAATEYEQATSVEDGGQYLVVYQYSSYYGTSYYAMDKNGNAVELTMSDGKLNIGDYSADDLLWTFDKSGSGWTITDGNGQKLGMSGSYSRLHWTITAEFNGGGTQNTFAVNASGSGWTVCTIDEFTTGGWFGSSTYGYLVGGTGSFSGSTRSGTLYLYEAAEPTYTVTIHGINEEGKTIGTTTVQLPAGTQSVSAPTFTDYVVVPSEKYPNPAPVVVTPDNSAEVTFLYRQRINANPLKVEFWITNGRAHVVGGADTETSVEIEATAAYSEEGIDVTALIPAYTEKSSRELKYWHATMLDKTARNSSTSGTEEQTEDSGDDETRSGDTFTKVRYWDGAWQVYTIDGEWLKVESKHQIVAYYMEQMNIADELEILAADWGKKGDGTGESFDYSDVSLPTALAVQIVYEDSSTNPVNTTANALRSKSIVFNNWAGGRGIGTWIFNQTSDYEIIMVTADTGTAYIDVEAWGPAYINSFNWDETPETVWEGDPSKSVTLFNDAQNPSTQSPYDHLMWTMRNGRNDKNAILLRVYVKTVETPDSLKVHYIDETDGVSSEFYNYNISVKQGATFDTRFALQNGQLIYNTVVNSVGETQTVTADLSQLTEIGADYRYREYTCTRVGRSEDGKDVYLYYTFNDNAYNFVVDYGLPLTITTTDLGLDAGNWTDITVSRAQYGDVVAGSGTTLLTYTPTDLINGREQLTMTLTSATGEKVAHVINLYPASTVYYEAEDQSFVNYSGSWTNVGASSGGSQQTERLGSSSAYGSDRHYNTNQVAWSNGAAKQVTVNTANGEDWPTATFTFTGTGVDIISRTDSASGTVLVEVKDTSSAQKVKAYLVNGYYGYIYVDGKWNVNPSSKDAIYQVPVIKVDGLAYGTYEVTVKPFYSDLFDVAGKNSFTFSLDAIRVYNPLNTGNVYAGDGEANPAFVDLSEQVESFDSNGTFIDGNPTADKGTYENYGPNHEIYLSAGQSVTLTLSDAAGKNAQIGARVMEGNTGTIAVDGKSIQVKGGTDQYYEITNGVGNTVTITNTGDTRIALTTLKLTSK